jgi:penicillin-binding protein 1A
VPMRWLYRFGALAVLGTLGWLWWATAQFRSPGPEYQRQNLWDCFAPDRHILSYEEMPLGYTLALLAAEDPDFWRHGGLNLQRIGRVLLDNTVSGRFAQGGSTLTLQLARNLFQSEAKHLARHRRVLADTLRLEASLEKTDILELYVDQFYVYRDGYGLAYASRFYFDKEPTELSLEEGAFIAGMLPSPTSYNPFRDDKSRLRAHERTAYVLEHVAEIPAESLVGPLRARPAAVEVARWLQAEARARGQECFELPFVRGAW